MEWKCEREGKKVVQKRGRERKKNRLKNIG